MTWEGVGMTRHGRNAGMTGLGVGVTRHGGNDGESNLLRHDGWGTATLQCGASNRATGDSRLRGNDVGGRGMPPALRLGL